MHLKIFIIITGKKKILLLVDNLEKFISMCLIYYGLDPCHCFSAPGLSWDAMLKMTKIELGKISDPDKYMFFEQGMRGDISYINKIYSKANNVKIMIKKNLKIIFILILIIYMYMQ